MVADQPWLSVVIPVYQGERYLEDMFSSIATQQDPGVELIVIDDGSTDHSTDIIEKWRSQCRMTVLTGERSGNWVATTNRGMAIARGAWISLLHQDDAWLPGRLSRLRMLMEENPQANLFLHPAQLIDETGRRVGRWRCPLPSGRLIGPELMLPRLIVQNFIPICSPIFRRELAESIGPLNEDLWYFADWDYWLRLSSRGDVIYHATPLASYRIHPASQTARRTRDIDNIRDQFDRVTGQAIQNPSFPASKVAQARRMQHLAREVYAFMLATHHRQSRNWRRLFAAAFLAGPMGWLRYVTYARLWDRLIPRLTLQSKVAKS